MIPHLILKSFNIAATACTGNQIYSEADGACYSTNFPTVNATSSELQTVLQIFFGILGALALLFVIIGGMRYTVSGGNPQSMEKAKDTIIYAVVGLVVALSAEAIVTFALNFIK